MFPRLHALGTVFAVKNVVLLVAAGCFGAEIRDCIVQPINREVVTIVAVVDEVSLNSVEQSRVKCGLLSAKQQRAIRHYLVVSDLEHARNWTLKVATDRMRSWVRKRKIGEALDVRGTWISRVWDGRDVLAGEGWTLDLAGDSIQLVHVAPWWLPTNAILRVPRLYFVTRKPSLHKYTDVIRVALERQLGTAWEYRAYIGGPSAIETVEGFTAVTPFSMPPADGDRDDFDIVVCESRGGVLACVPATP